MHHIILLATLDEYLFLKVSEYFVCVQNYPPPNENI